MWIIFGWQKIETPLGEVGSAYCYDCRRDTPWMVWNESEWVTFSDLKVFRFIHRHHLECSGCSSTLDLHSSEFKQIDHHMRNDGTIDGTTIRRTLVARIELQQLASKTPLQLKFIKESMKARREYKERMAAQEEGM